MKALPALLAIGTALIAGAYGGYLLARTETPTALSAALSAATVNGTESPKKLLYYRNPMGLPDTSPVPKKDSMGMDYIPVYAGETSGDSDSGLSISAGKVQKMGVTTEAAREESLARRVHASGRIEIDESRVFAVSAKYEGYIERLHANTTGQPVGRGQPLFEVYSPELVSAQREYAIAAQGIGKLQEAGGEAQSSMKQLAESSLLRLKNWDISEEQIKALSSSATPKRTLTFRSPVSGIITEKKAVQGMRFMPGEALFQIADTSTVWVIAEVFEQDIATVNVGQAAQIRINAYPGESFSGRIAYIYPTLKAETRTVPVRIALPNPKGKLKPAMYAEVDLLGSNQAARITVPTSAVIDSGSRQVVIVQRAEGRFAPRPVKVGQRNAERVEILSGLQAGEKVVTTAQFLIDAESNLQAALNGMQKPDAPAAKPATVGHQAVGILNAIDPASGSLTISHEPVASLNWPSMKMDFVLANPALLNGIPPGSHIAFEFVERQPGEWVITAIAKR